MISCHRCGKTDNQDHYKFCLGCGASLQAAAPGHERLGTSPVAGAAAGVAMMPPAAVAGAVPAIVAPPAAAATPGPRPCPTCATEVPATFRFCGSCGHKMDIAPAVPTLERTPGVAASPSPAVAAAPKPTSLLTLIRPDGSEGGTHPLSSGDNQLGRNHGAIFASDGYLSPTHAELAIGPQGATIRDLGGLNGVFIKMRDEEEIVPGQVIRIGQELLRFDIVPPAEPGPDGTEVMGSPNPGYWGKLSAIIGRGVDGAAYPLLAETTNIGRERGDINFPQDGYVSGLHAKLSLRAGRVFLQDLGSSNGTFLRVHGERRLTNETFLLLGQQLFRLSL